MELLIVVAVVGAAVGYAGWKAWEMFKPGVKTVGCSCGSAKSGCAGCPQAK